MAEYNIDNLSQDKILDLISSKLYCGVSGLNNVGSFPENSIILVYEDIDLNTEEEERKEKREGIVTRPYSRGSSISNIIKLIKV